MTAKKEIVVTVDATILTRADALFAAPEEAEQQQDLMRMWSASESSQGKFTLHTMAQRALFDFEDNELSVQRLEPEKSITASFGGETVVVTSGVVLAMDNENRLSLYAHEGVDALNILRAIHRYATRMIRLDVR